VTRVEFDRDYRGVVQQALKEEVSLTNQLGRCVLTPLLIRVYFPITKSSHTKSPDEKPTTRSTLSGPAVKCEMA
jgi:hypothetical protein